MTLNRRQFLGSAALPLIALGSGAPAQAADTASAEPDKTVVFGGDSAPHTPAGDAAALQALLQLHPDAADSYLGGGAVAALEAKFSALLGKEDTVFMPTGTLANHIAIRLLCGDARHALVQQESHVYRDESDCITTLSGINLVPLAAGKAAPTLDEIFDAIKRAEVGPYPIKVGAIALESPVRRAEGATVPAALIAEVAKLAREKHIPMHLDGARLLLMHGIEGFDVKSYCAPFDTVYVSLYKYLGAPYGAVLSGTRTMMAHARELRHLFGGTQYHAWQAALPALAALDGFEQRQAAVRAAGEQLLAGLEKTPGFKVQRVEHGSNIALIDIAPAQQAGLEQRLKRAQIRAGGLVNGRLRLTFNETLLRRDTAYLLAAFGAKA
ncbi:MAG: aminotransferase class I/II-fold pyridoxal phosphate-dependent enzyme [Pseudomonadota bacterium]